MGRNQCSPLLLAYWLLHWEELWKRYVFSCLIFNFGSFLYIFLVSVQILFHLKALSWPYRKVLLNHRNGLNVICLPKKDRPMVQSSATTNVNLFGKKFFANVFQLRILRWPHSEWPSWAQLQCTYKKQEMKIETGVVYSDKPWIYGTIRYQNKQEKILL